MESQAEMRYTLWNKRPVVYLSGVTTPSQQFFFMPAFDRFHKYVCFGLNLEQIQHTEAVGSSWSFGQLLSGSRRSKCNVAGSAGLQGKKPTSTLHIFLHLLSVYHDGPGAVWSHGVCSQAVRYESKC